jgi:hypothetical protein
VTGIRQDAWANENRIMVEEDKRAEQRGRYLHPTAFGLERERGVDYDAEEEARRAEQQRLDTEQTLRPDERPLPMPPTPERRLPQSRGND